MIITNQNKSIWKNLFEAAVHFRQTKPWNYYDDSHIFGIKDPKTETIGWCVLMGAAETSYGMQVYLGDEGFESYINIMDSWFTWEDEANLGFSQKSLILNFVNKDETDQADTEIYKQLGYSFKNNLEYISFRRFDPGFFPWYLTNQQVVFMTYCVEQALNVVELGKNEELVVSSFEDRELLVMVPDENHGELIWTPQQRPHPQPVPSKKFTPKSTFINQLRKKLKKRKSNLLLSVRYVFQPIQDKKGERPYFPKLVLWASNENGSIIDSQLIQPTRIWNPFQKKCQDVFKKLGYIPTRITVDSPMAMELMEDMAERLRIELILDPAHPILIGLQENMDEYFNQDQ